MISVHLVGEKFALFPSHMLHDKRGIYPLHTRTYYSDNLYQTWSTSCLLALIVLLYLLFLFSSRLLEWMRAASFCELHLELVRPTLMIFTTMIMRMHYELASTCLMYRYIHTNIHTYKNKYSDFLIAPISVGLAQARPNYKLA